MEQQNNTQPNQPYRLVLHCADKDYYINYADIVSLQAEGSQTFVHTRPGSIHQPKILVCKTLKQMEQLLPLALFNRVHKSWMVNLQYVRWHKKGEAHSLQMVNEQQIPVAETRLKQVLTLLEQFTSPPTLN